MTPYGSREKSESMFSAFIRDYARVKHGSVDGFANSLGIAYGTVSRWIRGTSFPIEGPRVNPPDLLPLLCEETGKSQDELKKLGAVSVEQACEIVLGTFGDVDSAALRHSSESHQRFLDIVKTRGGEIPPAIYVEYLTGDKNNQEAIVNILEQTEIS